MGKLARSRFTFPEYVALEETGLGTYPDASVICDRFEADPEDPKGHTAINPTVLVEVLSPSTEAYDRGEKLDHYRRIPSLREVLHIAHDADASSSGAAARETGRSRASKTASKSRWRASAARSA
ncbi:MAG: Uma2 family endonuclease [Sandaracinaceae bacterium]